MSWSMYICPTDLYFNIIFILKFVYLFYCVVLENVHTHPKEIIGNSRDGEGLLKEKYE